MIFTSNMVLNKTPQKLFFMDLRFVQSQLFETWYKFWVLGSKPQIKPICLKIDSFFKFILLLRFICISFDLSHEKRRVDCSQKLSFYTVIINLLD